MTQNLDDKELYKLFKSLCPPTENPDPMTAAEMAESGGDLNFLTEPMELEAVPPSLLTRARALAPRMPLQRRSSIWRQMLAALATVLAFGSGSYALANTIGGSDVTDLQSEALSWETPGGLYETATDTGLLSDSGWDFGE